MGILVNKSYVDKFFDNLKDSKYGFVGVDDAVDTMYVVCARPAAYGFFRETASFSYLCSSRTDKPSTFVKANFGSDFKSAFTGALTGANSDNAGNLYMYHGTYMDGNGGNYFGRGYYVNTKGGSSGIQLNYADSSAAGAPSYTNIMGSVGERSGVDDLELNVEEISIILYEPTAVNSDLVVSVTMEDDNSSYGGSFSFWPTFTDAVFETSEIESNKFLVTITATAPIDSTEVEIAAGNYGATFTLTVTKPYATSIELLKNNNTLSELELTLDENGKASDTFIVKITMDTSNAIYRDSLTFTEVAGVEFNYSIPSSNEIEVTVNADKVINSTPITVTARGENGNLTSSFNLSVLEYDGGGSLTDPIIPTSDYPFFDFYIWDLCSPSNEEVLEEYHIEINFGNCRFYAGVASTVGIRAVAGYKITSVHIWQSWWDEIEGPSVLYSDISYTQDGDYFTFKPDYAGLGWSDSTTDPYLHIDVTVEEE